jgi:hypothetical protein
MSDPEPIRFGKWKARSVYFDVNGKPQMHTDLPTLTDEIIADLWHKNGGFHHHFARAVERRLKGEK